MERINRYISIDELEKTKWKEEAQVGRWYHLNCLGARSYDCYGKVVEIVSREGNILEVVVEKYFELPKNRRSWDNWYDKLKFCI